MKFIYQVLFVVIFSSFTSCSDGLNDFKNDLEKDNLKGDVVLVATTTIYAEEVALPGGINVEVYNEKGMLTKSFDGISGGYFHSRESIYDSEQKISVKTSGDYGNGVFNGEEKYSYGINGKLESINSKDFNITYSYNEDAYLIKVTTKSIGSMEGDYNFVVDYFYSDNKLDSTISIYNIRGDISSRTEILGDGNKIEKNYKVDGKGDKTLTYIISFKKNEKGDFIEEFRDEFNSYGVKLKTSKIEYVYNYDKNGNWIQKRTVEDGALKSTTNRTIVYKGEETRPYFAEIEKVISSLNNEKNNSNNSRLKNENTEPNSLNSSDGSNQQPESRQQTEKVNCYYCKGSANCNECGKVFRVHTWDGNGWKDRSETRLGYVMCSDCRGAGVFYKKNTTTNKWEIEKECYVNSCNNGWVYCKKCNAYGNGKILGKCAECKGTGQRN